MFLQIHTLTAYPASLLNRDDAGLAKRIPFGNAVRLRISSQCLKRHWREALQEQNLLHDGYRTRYLFNREVRKALLSELQARGEGEVERKAEVLVRSLINLTFKKSKSSSSKERPTAQEPAGEDARDAEQAVYFSEAEVRYLTQLGLKMLEVEPDLDRLQGLLRQEKETPQRKKEKQEFRNRIGLDEDNLEAMRKSAAGLTSALFGRMVTSDLLAQVHAPVHVAHAFTVHPAQTELDYFTVVDDLAAAEETGAAHANQTELGAGIYYGYVAVDVPLLVSNLTGCAPCDWRSQPADLPRRVLDAFIRTAAEVSPGAKRGATAPYSRAEFVLLETGVQQPRQLANAFLEAVRLNDTTSPMLTAIAKLGDYLERIDRMYGRTADTRAVASLHELEFETKPLSLSQAIDRTLNAIWSV